MEHRQQVPLHWQNQLQSDSIGCICHCDAFIFKGIAKAKDKLSPFGVFHLLSAKKHSKDVIFYLIGIHLEYQNKEVTAIIFNEYYKTFEEKGIVNCIRTPELEDNIAIRQMWKHFGPVTHKKRQT